MHSRMYYEIRVRLGQGKNEVKKSRFYFAKSPSEAVSRYKGPGSIISVEKVPRERLFGVGEFFILGDRFLEDLSQEKGNGNHKI